MSTIARREMIVKKRDGRTVSFDRELIARAIRKAFRADLALAQDEQMEGKTLAEIEGIIDAV